MATQAIRAAVVGASSLLGKELLEEISASAPATWDVQALEAGTDVEGQLTSAGDEALVVHSLSESSLSGQDFVFFAGEGEPARQFVGPALRAGAAVIDLTGVTAGDSGFLLRSPLLAGGQRPDLTTQGITVPHAAAWMLALVAERLRAFGVKEMSATVLEPASEAGSAGVDELHQQTVSLLSFQELPKAVFDAQVAFNLLGSPGEASRHDLSGVRNRIDRDLQSLLGEAGGLKVPVNVLQAPVFHGYVISCLARLQAPSEEAALRAAFAGPGLAVDPDLTISNQAATESGDVLMRVRTDGHSENAVWLTLAADNLRLLARNAVAAALELAALRPAARVQ